MNNKPLIQTIASILQFDYFFTDVFFSDKKVEIGDTAIKLGIVSDSTVKI